MYKGFSDFLVSRFKEIYKSDYKKIINSMSKPPKKAIRVNTLKTSVRRCIASLESKGFKFSEVPWSKYSFFIEREPKPIVTTIEYLSGYIYVQDPTSMLPVIELSPHKDESVLDMAASPGGKTTHMAQLMENKGTIVAVDVNSQRMDALLNNIMRLGVENVISVRMNAKKISNLGLSFDKILLDAPCSSDGTVGKNPRLKTALKQEDYKNYPKIQKKLIEAAREVLNPGGVLMYSTCSMAPEEDEEVVEYAVREMEFKVEQLKLRKYMLNGMTRFFSRNHPSYLSRCGRIMPYQYNTQGFFLAKLRI